MQNYLFKGIHCDDCAEDLEEKLKRIHPSIQVDYDEKMIYLPLDADIRRVRRVLSFEKVMLDDDEHEKMSAHSSSHHHGHHHGHSHTVSGESTKKMAIVLFVNLFFAVIEAIFGILFNSVAILTDAVHDFGDAISIGSAYYFEKYSMKEADKTFSFGHKRFSLVGAFLTASVLIVGSGMVMVRTVPRLFDPQPVHYEGMFWLSIFAIAANGYSAWLLSRGTSANESMLNLHLMEDVLGWVGVLAVSIILRFTDWYILDPLLSIGIAAFILWKTIPPMKEVVKVFLEAVPDGIDPEKFEQYILNLPQVGSVSHLHIWSIDGNEIAFTVTIATTAETSDEQEELKEKIRNYLKPYNVTHSTIELIVDTENWTSNR